MQAAATPVATPGARPCGECGASNPLHARFCKACGASVSPPPECPKCHASVTPEAHYCGQCGAKLVGSRPEAPMPVSLAKEAPAPAPKAPAPTPPPPRKASSSITGNVLVFIAVALVILVAIREMNRDAPKSVSPFEGGPPAPRVETPQNAAPPAEAPQNATDPVRGTIALAASVGDSGGGTLFIIVRNQGVPGPPLAVKKVDDPKFPLNFEIGQGDVMMQGAPFVGPFEVSARLDSDGNAMTKTPGDLVNANPVVGVKPGEPTQLVLDKRL